MLNHFQGKMAPQLALRAIQLHYNKVDFALVVLIGGTCWPAIRGRANNLPSRVGLWARPVFLLFFVPICVSIKWPRDEGMPVVILNDLGVFLFGIRKWEHAAAWPRPINWESFCIGDDPERKRRRNAYQILSTFENAQQK